LVIGLVGVLLHSAHEPRVGQIVRPCCLLHQLLGQVGRAATALYGRVDRAAVAADDAGDGPPVVAHQASAAVLPASIQDADQDGVVVVVQADENRYSTHDSLLLFSRDPTHGTRRT